MNSRWFVPVAGAVLITAGCAAGTGVSPANPATTPPARAYTVQQLAAAVGCEATSAGPMAGLRQATCTVDGSPVVFVDFDTAKGQRDWLDDAEMYGGVYLVGDRWAVSGKSKDYLSSLKTKLGGQVEERSS